MRAETNVTLQTHQILRLPRKMTIQHLAEICGKQLKRHFQCAADPRPFRDRFRQSATRHSTEVTFSLRTNGLYWKIQHFAFRLSFQISPNTAPTTKSDTWTSPSTAPTTKTDTWTSPSTAPTTKSDTWPSPSTAPTTKSDTWASPSTAPSTKSDTWTSPSTAPTTKSDTWPSPSTAPATQNDSQAWSSSHMKRHFQCALPRKMTIQHLAEICGKQLKRHFQCAADPRPFRDRFRQSATRHATENTFRAPDERFVLKNPTFRAPAIFPNFTKSCAYHAKWHLNFTKYCAYHEDWHLNFTKYCAYHEKWHLTFTKYCACHTEWLAIVIDSTITQRFYLTLLLIESTVTQRLYLTLLLHNNSNWLYYYAAIVLDSTTMQWF